MYQTCLSLSENGRILFSNDFLAESKWASRAPGPHRSLVLTSSSILSILFSQRPTPSLKQKQEIYKSPICAQRMSILTTYVGQNISIGGKLPAERFQVQYLDELYSHWQIASYCVQQQDHVKISLKTKIILNNETECFLNTSAFS